MVSIPLMTSSQHHGMDGLRIRLGHVPTHPSLGMAVVAAGCAEVVA